PPRLPGKQPRRVGDYHRLGGGLGRRVLQPPPRLDLLRPGGARLPDPAVHRQAVVRRDDLHRGDRHLRHRLARLGEGLGVVRGRLWSSICGRDRYFALLLTSLFVRAAFDGWLLPLAGAYLTERLHVRFDYQNNLSSFGLIIIPLVANQFWKPGLAGLWPQAV